MLTPTLALLCIAQGLGPQSPAAKDFVPFDVTGRAVTWDGQPIAGARIAIGDAETPTIADLLRSEGPATAADGNFTLACPVPAKGQQDRFLFVAGKGFASRRMWLPGPGTPVTPGKPFALGDLVLAPGQRMVGRVRDAAGQPVAGALVTASDLLATMFNNGNGENFVCTARTSASGIFDLPCALAAGSQVEVTADGWFTVRRQPVAAGSPLEFELQPSGWIVGRAMTDTEKGLGAASLMMFYEADQSVQALRADATGAFRVPLRHPGRWRLRAGADGEQAGPVGWSKVGESAATGVVVTVAAKDAASAPKKLVVRATTKGSGAAVRTFRAVAAWGEMVSNGKPWLRQMLSNQVRTVEQSANGSFEVDGPPDESASGAVYITAEGHAPLLQMDVTWNAQSPTLTVELEPEASVRGVVRDAATKKPLAGAAVEAIQQGDENYGFVPAQTAGGDGVPRSAADGTFRVGQLGEGEWQVMVAIDGRPSPLPLPVTLKAGEARGDVVVDVPAGGRVAGKLVGGTLAPGCRVSLQAISVGNENAMPFVFAIDSFAPSTVATVPGKPLAADGTFVFEGQALGHYTLLLHVPAPPRSGGALSLPVDSFRLREVGIQRDIDIAGDSVRTIRGKLSFPETTTPFENLVVVAEPVYAHGWMMHGGTDLAQGLHTIAGRDGSFVLPVLPGSYRVAVVDLALGIVVAASKQIEVRDADVQRDVEVPLTQVTIELKPASGEAMAFVDRLELRSMLASQRELGGGIDLDDSYDIGRGVRLPRGAKSVTLALPHGDVTFLARSYAATLRSEPDQQPAPALGKLDVQIPGEKKTSFVLEVGAPPEIAEETKGGAPK